MTENPPISIIVPCYNQGKYLRETLNSVRNQAYQNWECIIVNDGSADETHEVATSFVEEDCRFRYFSQSNMGLSGARNTGIKVAHGDFIQLLDSDDLIEQNALSSKVSHLKDHVINYSSMKYFESDKPEDLKIVGREGFIAHTELKWDDSHASQYELLKLRNPFVISAPLYPRLVFEQIGFFDINLSALEDWDFNFRCVHAGFKFNHVYGSDGRTLIRLHDNSMMRNQQLLDINFLKLIAKHELRPKEDIRQKKLKDYMKDFIPPIIMSLKRRLF
ncbi:glycosyltransferase family 2 protein [Pedobacter sandarakinus]|uniref:glycosyltransferase family 2 protein n=1 Tax=Pedobacter sandarakinus TaxID=353156 RepID=UPI002247239A|nr:glycosyltransferase [Pedobacter sandarakinus]MCX2575929.1 glycosyltransferase [Pedobacter sandarakinus]